ncbi:MAG: 50S ribosomal protein L11 methyltransferase [Planctomycetota bacterium]|jgi:ribosomal protein L11 methyltransferase
MSWVQLIMDLERLDSSRVEEALLREGALAICLQDAGDDPVIEPGPGMTPLWPHIRVTALFPANTSQEHLLEKFRVDLGVDELPDVRFEILEDRAWEREWLKHFKPQRFGRRLWICPSGHETPSASAVTVHLDPGLAFGTGTHPTTALCLEWLDSEPLEGRSVLDFGCGSGILGIAAARLGAARVVALDTDPQALDATRANAAANLVEDRVEVLPVGQPPKGEFDYVLANILAEPLLRLAPTLARLTRPRGSIVLSGILTDQVDQLTRRFGEWFGMQSPMIREDWARVTGRRTITF